jgi:ubiquitin C
MQLRVRSLTGRTIDVEVDETSSVSELKAAIEEQEALPASVQRLIYSGHELEDDAKLVQLGIAENSVIHLVIRQTRDLTDEVVFADSLP